MEVVVVIVVIIDQSIKSKAKLIDKLIVKKPVL